MTGYTTECPRCNGRGTISIRKNNGGVWERSCGGCHRRGIVPINPVHKICDACKGIGTITATTFRNEIKNIPCKACHETRVVYAGVKTKAKQLVLPGLENIK